jgi:hypothetical protein
MATIVEINSILVSFIYSCNKNGFLNGSRKVIEARNYNDFGSEQVTKTVFQITSFSFAKQHNTIGRITIRTGVPFGLTLRDLDSDCDLLAIFSTFQDQDHLFIQDYGFFQKTVTNGTPNFNILKVFVTNLAPLIPAIDHLVLLDQDDDWGYQVYRQSLERLQSQIRQFGHLQNTENS